MRRLVLRLLPRPAEIGSDRAIQALIAGLPRGQPSMLARTAARLGMFALPVTVFAVLLLRTGRVELAPGLAALAAGLLLAAAAVLGGVAALIQIWRRGSYGADYAFAGILLGLVLLAVPLASAALVLHLPAIYDVATDVVDPPPFMGAAAARASAENPAAYPGADAAEQQAAAYPDVEPLQLDVPLEDVYAAAVALVADRGWTMAAAESPPLPGAGEAGIQASASSLILAFPQDIAIRIRADGEGSRIDMRSASRLGRHDLGWNAWRVESFLRDLGLRARGRESEE